MSQDSPIVPRGRSINDTMAELCVSRATINRALAQGRLQAVKVGSKTLITSASIDDFWNSLPPAKFRAQRQKAA